MTTENTSDNNSEIAALKNQVFTLLIALIMVAGTLTSFLYRQTSTAGKDLAQGQQLTALVAQNEQALNAFITKLVAYGEKHPDFASSVLKKYGIAPVPGIPANAPAGTAPKK